MVRVDYKTLLGISEKEEFDCLLGADGPDSLVRSMFWTEGERKVTHRVCRFSFMFPLPEGGDGAAERSVGVLREELCLALI